MDSNEFSIVTRSRSKKLLGTPVTGAEDATPTVDVNSQTKTNSQVKNKIHSCNRKGGNIVHELTINLNVTSDTLSEHSSPIVINLGSVLKCTGVNSGVKCRKSTKKHGAKKTTQYSFTFSSPAKVSQSPIRKRVEDSFNTFSPKATSSTDKMCGTTPTGDTRLVRRRLNLSCESIDSEDVDSTAETEVKEELHSYQTETDEADEPICSFRGLFVNGDFSESDFEKEPFVRLHRLTDEEIRKYSGGYDEDKFNTSTEEDLSEYGSFPDEISNTDGVINNGIADSSKQDNSVEKNCLTALHQNMLKCGLYMNCPIQRYVNEEKKISTANDIGKENVEGPAKDVNVLTSNNARPDTCSDDECGISEVVNDNDENVEDSDFNSDTTVIRAPSVEYLLSLIDDDYMKEKEEAVKQTGDSRVSKAVRKESTAVESESESKSVTTEDEGGTPVNITSSPVLYKKRPKVQTQSQSSLNSTDITAQAIRYLNLEYTESPMKDAEKRDTQCNIVKPHYIQSPRVEEQKSKTRTPPLKNEEDVNKSKTRENSPDYVILRHELHLVQLECIKKEIKRRRNMELGLTPKLRNKSLRKSLYEKELNDSKDKLVDSPSSTKSKSNRSSKFFPEEKKSEDVKSEMEGTRRRLRSQTPVRPLSQTESPIMTPAKSAKSRGRKSVLKEVVEETKVEAEDVVTSPRRKRKASLSKQTEKEKDTAIEEQFTPRQKKGKSKDKTDTEVSEKSDGDVKSPKLWKRKLSSTKADKTPERVDKSSSERSATPKRKSRKIRGGEEDEEEETSAIDLNESPERRKSSKLKCETPKRMSETKKKKKQLTEESAESQEVERETENESPEKQVTPSAKKMKSQNNKTIGKSPNVNETREDGKSSSSKKSEEKKRRMIEIKENRREKSEEDNLPSTSKKRTTSGSKSGEGDVNKLDISGVAEIVQSPKVKKRSSKKSNMDDESEMSKDESETKNSDINKSAKEKKVSAEHVEEINREEKVERTEIRSLEGSPSPKKKRKTMSKDIANEDGVTKTAGEVILSPKRIEIENQKTQSPKKNSKKFEIEENEVTPVTKKSSIEETAVINESVTDSETLSVTKQKKKKKKNKRKGMESVENSQEDDMNGIESSVLSTESMTESQKDTEDENGLGSKFSDDSLRKKKKKKKSKSMSMDVNNSEGSQFSLNCTDTDQSSMSVSKLPDDFLRTIKEKKSEVDVVNNYLEKKKKKKEKKNKEKKKLRDFGDGYIPLDVAGPTKFSVVELEKLKNNRTRHPAFDLKNSLIYGSRIRRVPYSEILAYQMKELLRKTRLEE